MKKPNQVRSAALFAGLATLLALGAASAWAQNGRSAVSFVSVCSDGTVPGTSGSCPGQTNDTHQIVVGPDGVTTINSLGDLKYLADEHSSIFPPKSFSTHPNDYLFFSAGGGGLSILKSTGPNANGQWQLGFTPGYGYYSKTFGWGPVFSAAMQKSLCPTVAHPRLQDPTYDLNYGAIGTVVKDPTNPTNAGPGSLIMIYEGTNRCIGLTGGSNLHPAKNSFYSTIAVATSNDEGRSWPSYRYLLDANGDLQFPLPLRNPCATVDCPKDPTLCTLTNPCVGPKAPTGGSFGDLVCILNDCHASIPANYGRYAVFSPADTLQDAVLQGKTLKQPLGYQAPSAFLDDANGDPLPYLYTTAGGLKVTRAQLNGGTAALSFNNWYQGAFSASQPGVGGLTSPISFLGPQGLPENCEAAGQHPTMASFSYVEPTQQYLLTFVCMSSIGDPATQTGGAGAAWFYSTNADMSHQDHWSAPREIVGSWVPYVATKNGCADYDGWYPSFMSLNNAPGHLAASGFTFYMYGCTGGSTPGGRRFSSRAFTINLKSTRTFQGVDTRHVYVLGTDGNLWFEPGPFGNVPPARVQVDGSVSTFQALEDGTGNVLVLDEEGNLLLDSPPFGTVPPARVQVDYSVRSFQALNSQTVFVLGNDGNLSLEYAAFGTLPPFRQPVDASVRDFHALDANRVLVLGTDGNLWLERAPFGTVPPARVQVDGNVYAFQKAPGNDAIYVLGADGNLWLEQPPFGTVPPARALVDGNVRSFQALDSGDVFVLGTDGNLWLEAGPFGGVPPSRQLVDAAMKAFHALDLLHVYALDRDGNLWLEQAPFGTAHRQPVDANVN